MTDSPEEEKITTWNSTVENAAITSDLQVFIW
jgi:hypothetical protein